MREVYSMFPSEEMLTIEQPVQQPLLIVISGLSGVGKDAVVKGIQKRNAPFHFVVTANSRPKRPGEIEGVDYFFVTQDEFERMIAEDELIEYALVYESYKGIPKAQVREALHSGMDVMMRLDVQGAASVRALSPDAILVFLLPATVEEWYERLRNRGTESEEIMQLRLATARKELERLHEFDYVVVNRHGHLDEAIDAIMAIVRAEHLRVHPRRIDL
ncbi:MAG TPA: guanylate kinase [Levilinea sp.]|nr:guanylate kinase [Levilinea sp.]